MIIIAVDDERPAVTRLSRTIRRVNDDATVMSFISATDALKYAQDNKVDVAFLDIEMVEMNGLILAKKLKDINSDTNIIFVTGYYEYAQSAFDLYASGYVIKPINPERVKDELDNLRNPVPKGKKEVSIQCFGNFEIFADGIPITFKRSKSKEALAYLVDRRGAGVSKKEIGAILLEDNSYSRSTQSYIHTILSEMIKSLADADIQDIVIKKNNLYAVDVTKFKCDYYDFKKGDITAINSYHGEYMTNYDWAEYTAAHLSIQPHQ